MTSANAVHQQLVQVKKDIHRVMLETARVDNDVAALVADLLTILNRGVK